MNSSSETKPGAISLNRFFNPALLVAIALHALLLWLPLSGGSKSAQSASTEAEEKAGLDSSSSAPAKDKTAANLTSSDIAGEKSAAETADAKSDSNRLLSATSAKAPGKRPPVETLQAAATRVQTSGKVPPKRVPPRTIADPAASTNKPATPSTTPAQPKPVTLTARTPASSSRPTAAVPSTVPTFTRAPAPPAPAATPASSVEASPAVTPAAIATASPASSAGPFAAVPAPPPVRVDAYGKFPFYPLTRSLIGSLGLRPPGFDRNTYAFNTRESMKDAIAFYEEALPKDIFEPLKLETEGENLTIYQVKPKNSNDAQYLHLIPFQGRTAILLLPEKIADVEGLKAQAVTNLEEQRSFFRVFTQMMRLRQQFRSLQFSESTAEK